MMYCYVIMTALYANAKKLTQTFFYCVIHNKI